MTFFRMVLTKHVTSSNITNRNKGGYKNGEYYFKSFTVEEYDNL